MKIGMETAIIQLLILGYRNKIRDRIQVDNYISVNIEWYNMTPVAHDPQGHCRQYKLRVHHDCYFHGVSVEPAFVSPENF